MRDGKFKKKKKEVTLMGNRETVQTIVDKINKGCYICNGDHRMKDCPKRGKLNVLVAENNDGDDNEGGSTRVNPLQLPTALQEKPPPKQKGLLYVQMNVNEIAVMAMLDFGATYNFIAVREVQKMGLTLAERSSRIKAVNSEAKPIQGMAVVDLTVGNWKGKCELMVVPLDDFDVILGMDFLLTAKAAIIHSLNGLFIADETCPGFVQGTFMQDTGKRVAKLAYNMVVNEKCDVYSFGVVALETISGSRSGGFIKSMARQLGENDVSLQDFLDK
ncbi:hypothetical protein Salat_2154000, partial [Sesamum alatum]